jgi:hypothetical protein
MKPDWDTLMTEFDSSATQLVGDVDCTAAGKPLCDANGVKGYPTIKFGDPTNLEDYQGGRDLASLKTFIEEKLKPVCSPLNIDLCDDEAKAGINKYLEMAEDELKALIEAEEKKLGEAEEAFKAEVQKLQERYQELTKEKDEQLAAVKDAGLGLMKSCASAAKKKADDAKDEL